MHGASSISSSRAGSIGAGPSAYVDVALQREAGATKVAVVGAGFLGKCIAIELSLLGVSVLVCDTNPQTAAAVRSTFSLLLLLVERQASDTACGLVCSCRPSPMSC